MYAAGRKAEQCRLRDRALDRWRLIWWRRWIRWNGPSMGAGWGRPFIGPPCGYMASGRPYQAIQTRLVPTSPLHADY